MSEEKVLQPRSYWGGRRKQAEGADHCAGDRDRLAEGVIVGSENSYSHFKEG